MVTFTKQDMYNEVRRQRALQDGDVDAAIRFLEGVSCVDGKMFWKHRLGPGQHLSDLFWSDGRSQYDYGVFGDVLAFDAMYERNKYNLSVVVFSGEAMLDECGKREVEWVQELYRKKYSLATAYIRRRFFAGIRTTSRCESLHAKLGRFVENRYCVIEFVTNFQRCVRFLRDNEDELEFRSCYGTPVLQTQFVKLEKSGAKRFTREMFWRYRESLKRYVRVRINTCVEIEGGQTFNVNKYHKPQMAWQLCKKLGRVACMSDEDFKSISQKVVNEMLSLEMKYGLRGDNPVSNEAQGGGVKDPISFLYLS
ncbi:hypothetical protein Ahy_B06g084000 [Arachis hypogaea]|uniref:Uncharacterized protein n=1 Tax=Arachis hypogaea TaxID=3818 RepID=A0A444YQU4_ARAHY|nr:hypothetical protein Ahy_B06g084000 [Arachis hypogaea]